MHGFTTTLNGTSFEQALAKTLAVPKAEGFGVLSDVDVQNAMNRNSASTCRPTAFWAPVTHRWRSKPCRRCPTSDCCCPAM